MNPIACPEYDIYDIFYNDCNQLIIISPSEHAIRNIYLCIGDSKHLFSYNKDPHNHTYIYYITPPSCESNTVTLSINNNITTTHVNRYPVFTDKILMSTIIKNEDAYVIQWIEFHTKLGIDHFIIYDNETSAVSTLKLTLQDYIDSGKVILINWAYPYRMPISGLSGQTTQQNHSIYAFRTAAFIGLLDIDEYVNPQNTHLRLPDMFYELEQKYSLTKDSYGGFTLLNKFFYNPHNLPSDGIKFLQIYNCDKLILHERFKIFVIPKNITTFSVHMITSGKSAKRLTEDECFFNHYFYLNKGNTRGIKLTELTDDSIRRFV